MVKAMNPRQQTIADSRGIGVMFNEDKRFFEAKDKRARKTANLPDAMPNRSYDYAILRYRLLLENQRSSRGVAGDGSFLRGARLSGRRDCGYP
jgi:hypothetical protein